MEVWNLWATKCTCSALGSAERKDVCHAILLHLPSRVFLAKTVRQVLQDPPDPP